jgi:hypothetical protein
VENFGEYLLGALGCINMVLAMRKFEIQWTFCDYVAPALEEAGETMLGKRGSFLVLNPRGDLVQPAPVAHPQLLQRRGDGQADCAASARSICYHQICLEGIKPALHAFYGSKKALQIYTGIVFFCCLLIGFHDKFPRALSEHSLCFCNVIIALCEHNFNIKSFSQCSSCQRKKADALRKCEASACVTLSKNSMRTFFPRLPRYYMLYLVQRLNTDIFKKIKPTELLTM